MKICLKIVQWVFAVTFVIGALGNGFNFSGVLILTAGILMMPIAAIRNALAKIKIKSWLAVTLSLLLFYVGIGIAPQSNISIDDINEAISSSYDVGTDLTDSQTQNSSVSSQSSIAEEISSTETQNEASSAVSQSSQTAQSSQQSSSQESSEKAGVGTGKPASVKISDIPDYSGTAYITVNNNQPNFSADEIRTTGYEKYSELDSLGRCGMAVASCGKEIMPKENEKRGNISGVKPSGWIQAKYSGISGGYLWNRCHLIGWQLSAENASRKNLITGTRYMNINGMLTFENMVADYIKESGNHVAYRITPIYEGNNLVCSGVQMEAYSVEDSGEGICFNVYCYNVQPGITINYATGESEGPKSETAVQSSSEAVQSSKIEAVQSESVENQTEIGEMVWIPKSGKKYHSHSGCSNMKNPTQVSITEAQNRGFEPCKKCY